ncbi:MAG: DNA repair protein RecN [Chitinophagaceae bacterium]|nr:DNA repair protein RecN [Chitinophagaceae bacterium]
MLQQLLIQNYAIITEIKIDFSNKLNVITGETGAGKSILMGALSLILGERADTSVLLQKEKKCFIEGVFKTQHLLVKDYLKENDFDTVDEIVIRREISPNGKSRAFINDTPVNLSQLKELSSLLVDLHQQFDTLELGDNDFQREVIDALANHSGDINQYRSLYKKYLAEKRQLEAWKQQQSSANKELDYHKFLFNELEEAGFRKNELEEMDADLKVMSNAENIKATLNKIYFELQENEQPVIQQIKSLNNHLQTLLDFHTDITSLIERMHSAQIELQDIADEVDRLNNSVKYDAQKINTLNERLALGYRLLKKHNVQTTGELLAVKDELQQKLDIVLNLEENICKKEKEVNEFYEQAQKIADKISVNRQKQIKPFEEKVNKLLTQVGMPNAKIKVELKTIELNNFGKDAIEFLFDANKTRFEPLRKVASGGELSRLMLSIKSLVAKSIQLPTLIFDEIDTGISGEAARQVGIIMKDLSNAHQVIAITHQPQIAAKAAAHYFVYKEIKGDKIVTSIKLLNPDERITAIATMLSGERPTASAFENAREMIGN